MHRTPFSKILEIMRRKIVQRHIARFAPARNDDDEAARHPAITVAIPQGFSETCKIRKEFIPL